MPYGGPGPPYTLISNTPTPPRCFASQASQFHGFVYEPGRVISVEYFLEIHSATTLSITIELPFVVSSYNCPQSE